MTKSKFLTITVLTLFFITFIMGGNTFAQTNTEDISLRGGVSHIRFTDEDFGDINLDSGFGFYVGGKYKIQAPFSVIGQYERYSVSENITETDADGNTYSYDINLNLNSFVGLASYELMPSNSSTNIALLGGPGYYFGKMTVSAEGVEQSINLESALGFKFGTELNYKLQKNLRLNASGFYRVLEMEPENNTIGTEKGDFGGFELNGGLSYRF